jgi:hypothetical protein
MHLMLSSLFINKQPALTVTDKAYGRTAHFHPHHTDVERQMMAPNERILQKSLTSNIGKLAWLWKTPSANK